MSGNILGLVVFFFNLGWWYGVAFALSKDHKPNRDDERQRIEEAGGVVMWAGMRFGFYMISFLLYIISYIVTICDFSLWIHSLVHVDFLSLFS